MQAYSTSGPRAEYGHTEQRNTLMQAYSTSGLRAEYGPSYKNYIKKKCIKKKIIKKKNMNHITPCITQAGRDFYHEALVPISVNSEGILSGF